MSFLAPLYIAGTLFVALPVIFHLIRRMPRDRVLFSSLMFLRESPPRVTRRSRLENLLLLALRAAALTLLACAFARPFMREPLRAPADVAGGRVIAVALDTSASMRRDDCWAQAVAHVEQVLTSLRSNDHVALYTFDRQLQSLVSFDEWLETDSAARAPRLRELLGPVEPSWNSTRLGAALADLAEAVDRHAVRIASSGTVPEQRIVLVSDLQQGSDLSALREFDWPEHVAVELSVVRPRVHGNATLQVVQDNDDVAAAGAGGTVRIRVVNSSESPASQFRVGWGDLESGRTDVYVPPGRSRVIQLPVPPIGETPDKIVLTGDEQEFDNVAYAVPRRSRSVSVLCVGGGGMADSNGLLFYLERAFTATRWQTVRVLAHDTSERITAGDFAGVRFAVLGDWVPDETADALRTFVEAGGSLCCVLTSVEMAPPAGRIAGVARWIADEAVVRDYAMLSEIDFQHPLFAPFADPRFSDFTKIHFWRHRHADFSSVPEARVLARFDDRDPALVEISIGRGRLYVLTAGWQPTDSQLAVSSKFVPLLAGMLDHAVGVHETIASVRVGDTVQLRNLGSGAVRIRRPDGSDSELPDGAREFDGTNQPGIYAVQAAGPSLSFAVNLDPDESRTDPLPAEQLEQAGVRLTETKGSSRLKAEAASQRQLQAFELESRQKLWRWLIITVFGVLLVETWLAARIRTKLVGS